MIIVSYINNQFMEFFMNIVLLVSTIEKNQYPL